MSTDQAKHLFQEAVLTNDPVRLVQVCWPKVNLYTKQAEILRSVWENEETIVPAGNDLGKDFIAGLAIVCFFISRSPCRIVTTAPSNQQLRKVLWGEIKNFVQTSSLPLPVEVLDADIYQLDSSGARVAKSYVAGVTSKEDENYQGHHLTWGRDFEELRRLLSEHRPKEEVLTQLSLGELLRDHGGIGGSLTRPRTMGVIDEASGVEDSAYNGMDTWAHRKLIIGNPLPCTNFFFRFVEEGDVLVGESDEGL